MKTSKSLSSSARVLRPLRRRPLFWIGLICVLLTISLEVDCVTYFNSDVFVVDGKRGEEGEKNSVVIAREMGCLRLEVYMPSPARVPGHVDWTSNREALPESLHRLFYPRSYYRESMFQYTKVPKTGWNTFMFYLTIPGWVPLIATGTVWGTWILITMLRRQKALARISFDQAGIVPPEKEPVESQSGVAP